MSEWGIVTVKQDKALYSEKLAYGCNADHFWQILFF